MLAILCCLDKVKVTKKTRITENVGSVSMITGYGNVVPSKTLFQFKVYQ